MATHFSTHNRSLLDLKSTQLGLLNVRIGSCTHTLGQDLHFSRNDKVQEPPGCCLYDLFAALT